jgi:molecular chaperone GrpE (heat shock protein)
MLSDLLVWLDETRQWAAATSRVAAEPAPEDDAPETTAAAERADLFALLAAMTALRQEVKLQTRAARNDRDQAAGALEQLGHTVAQLERLRQEDSRHRDTAVQEATEATGTMLVELHDALSRSAQQASRILAAVGTTLRAWSVPSGSGDGAAGGEPPPGMPGEPPVPGASDSGATPMKTSGVRYWWRQYFARPTAPTPSAVMPAVTRKPDTRMVSITEAELRQMRETAARLAERLDGLAAGVQLNVQRLERALAAYNIEPLDCLGQPVDSEVMEVVQIVTDPAHPAGVVVDEIRRGYRRHGQVYRIAQVVASRSATPTNNLLAEPGDTDLSDATSSQ